MKFAIKCLRHDGADVIVADRALKSTLLATIPTLDSDDVFEIRDGDLYCNFDANEYDGSEGCHYVIRTV